jgi:monoamine oxidase
MNSDIIVIGAGAAGLMAAWKLAEKGNSVTILEARNRIGGRIHTIQSGFTHATELGAEFVHGDQPLTMSLIRQAGLSPIRMSGKSYHIERGEVSTGNFFEGHWGYLMKKLAELEADVDMATFLATHFEHSKYDDLREHVKRFVEGYDAADLNKVSALALRAEWAETDEAQQYHIKGGYSQLIEFIADKAESLGARIMLSSNVKKIKWSDGEVSIETDDGTTYESTKVVVTVPLGALQQGAVTFDPTLIEYERLISSLGDGGVIKFLAEFHPEFWKLTVSKRFNDAAFIFSDAEVPTWWSQNPDHTPLLTGWLGGPSTFDIDHDPASLKAKALNSLAYILNTTLKQLEENIHHLEVADWVTDRFAHGAYSYATVNGESIRAALNQPIQNTIYFAGEALYEGIATGTVEAALVSGEKVAKKI